MVSQYPFHTLSTTYRPPSGLEACFDEAAEAVVDVFFLGAMSMAGLIVLGICCWFAWVGGWIVATDVVVDELNAQRC